MGRLVKVMANLRQRPKSERRILAAVTYIALASVVVAAGTRSIGKAITSVPAATTASAPGGAGEATPASGTPAGDGNRPAPPPAPLAALREAGLELAKTIRGAAAGLERLERITALEQPPSGRDPFSPPASAIPPHPSSPAEHLAGIKTKPYSTYATARLLATPLTRADDGQDGGRIGAILTYNLRELHRTAKDIYEYLAQ